jgi:hypothetical protein
MAAITGTAVAATSFELNVGKALTLVQATQTATATTDTETFDITVTQNEFHSAIVIQNVSTTTATTFQYSIVAGTGTNAYWAAGSDTSGVTASGGAVTGTTHVVNIEGAKFAKTNGIITVKLTPAVGVSLAACAKVGYIQLP